MLHAKFTSSPTSTQSIFFVMYSIWNNNKTKIFSLFHKSLFLLHTFFGNQNEIHRTHKFLATSSFVLWEIRKKKQSYGKEQEEEKSTTIMVLDKYQSRRFFTLVWICTECWFALLETKGMHVIGMESMFSYVLHFFLLYLDFFSSLCLTASSLTRTRWKTRRSRV